MNDKLNENGGHITDRIFPDFDAEFEALYEKMQTPECQAALVAFSLATDDEINRSYRPGRTERKD